MVREGYYMKKRSALQNISNERQKPIQLCLFSEFISNNDGDMSNIVELWEGIPKYFLNDKQQTKLRTDTGHADPYSFEYVYADSKQGDIKRSVIIQPALIKQENESYKAFFPSMTEELVEESIKKIFTYQNSGFHDTEKIETWVRFSLRMIYRELKDRGRERNLAQIRGGTGIPEHRATRHSKLLILNG